MNDKCLFLAPPSNIRGAFSDEQIGGVPVRSEAEILASPLPETEVVFSTWGMPAFDEETIARLFPRLKFIFYAAGTVQKFARPFLRCGVRICSAWAANAVPVAEFAAAQIVLANKGYFQMHQLYRESRAAVEAYANTFAYGNYGSKVGLLGAGMIGKLVIGLLKPYRIEVLIYDPFVSGETAAHLGVRKAEMTEIFETCQTVSNHLPNKEEIRGILDYSLFSRMKPNATFINTGRAAQVVKADLLRAMREEPGRTALLDVTDPEEPLQPDSDYWDYPNVLQSPHRAGSMTGEVRRMGQYMMDEYERWCRNEKLLYEVTMEMLATMA